MAQAHIVDLPEDGGSLSYWQVVNIPSRLTVTSTWHEDADGSGRRRFIFEGPPGAYAVLLRRRVDEERTITFTIDETPVAAPGHIGADLIE